MRISKNTPVRKGIQGFSQNTTMCTWTSQKCLLWSADAEAFEKQVLTAFWSQPSYVVTHLLKCWHLLIREILLHNVLEATLTGIRKPLNTGLGAKVEAVLEQQQHWES